MTPHPQRQHGLPRQRAGFTLIELSVVIWALGFVLLIGMGTLLGAIKIEQAASAAERNLLERKALADAFRADVAGAASAPASAGTVQSSPTCLILQCGDNKQIVYRWEHGQLERSMSVGSKTSRQQLPAGRGAVAVAFTREGGDGRLITLQLTESRGSGKVTRRTAIAAALGGDIQ